MIHTPIKLSIEEKAYLAGIIDADGYIGITKYKNPGGYRYKPIIDIIGERILMDWLNSHVEKRKITIKHEPFVLTWRIYSIRSISEILRDIIPYMTTKKERGIIVKKLCDITVNSHNKRLRESLYQEFREIMNKWHDGLVAQRQLESDTPIQLEECKPITSLLDF